MFFFSSMFSQLVIYPYWFLYLPLFWGIVIPDYERIFHPAIKAEKVEFRPVGKINESFMVN